MLPADKSKSKASHEVEVEEVGTAETRKHTDDVVYERYTEYCELKELATAAAARLIFGEDKRLRTACEAWAGRRKLDTPAVQEAAKGVRALTRPFPHTHVALERSAYTPVRIPRERAHATSCG